MANKIVFVLKNPGKTLRFIKRKASNVVRFWGLKLGLMKRSFRVVSLPGGFSFKARNSTSDGDGIVIKEVWSENVYHVEAGDIRDGSVVFDLGANIGVFSNLAASMVRCDVYSFEPQPENFGMFLENIELNKNLVKGVIHPINKAVSVSDGTIDLFVDVEDGGVSSTTKPVGKAVKVACVSLENFMKENKIASVDFMKIDIEGGEYDILFSLPKPILDKIKKVALEYHNVPFREEYNADALLTFFGNNGFKTIHEPDKKMEDGSVSENRLIIAYK
ncbi:Hexuronic acid methyltransferase AglP [uncultured archaeon]|nr:Hexuronic acid methyltransferase AglP [uncultured archaeon]